MILQDLVFGRIEWEDVLVWQDDGRRQLVPRKRIGYARDGDAVADGWRPSTISLDGSNAMQEKGTCLGCDIPFSPLHEVVLSSRLLPDLFL